ncbi:MAG: hypothetical protein S4CHLAM102_12040 [Chlamydiia bacterium]|nr:hypothetical protein [Chlamydiia bacterium]
MIQMYSATDKPKGFVASRYQTADILFSIEGLKALFAHFDDCLLINTAGVVTRGEGMISLEEYCQRYGRYLECLQKGDPIDELAKRLTCTVVKGADDLYAIEVGSDRMLVKTREPAITIQCAGFDIKPDHSLAIGGWSPSRVAWGIEILFPQLYQDLDTMKVYKVFTETQNAMAPIFKKVQKWVRKETKTVKIKFQNQLIRTNLKMSPECAEWASDMPHLFEVGIGIER